MIGWRGFHEGEAAGGGERALGAEDDAGGVVDPAVGHGDGIRSDDFRETLAFAYPDFGDLDLSPAVLVGELVACDEEFVGGGDEDACFVG